MIELITIFVAGFVSVFALGFQSRNVNHGNYLYAAGTSFFIGISSAALWGYITSPTVGALGGIVYGLAGALAITASMYVHEKVVKEKSLRRVFNKRSVPFEGGP